MADLSVEFDREAVRRHGFPEFARRAWKYVEPGQALIWNWHLEQCCLHAQELVTGDLKELVVNIPPSSGKSMIFDILLDAWTWGPAGRPDYRVISSSFDLSLARNHAEQTLNLCLSPWYTERWGHVIAPRGSYDIAEYDIVGGGFRFTTSTGGKGTGRHAHQRRVDDPIKPADAAAMTKAVGAAIDKGNNWWRNTMASRAVNPAEGIRSLVVMQRIHENDLSQQCIDDGYEHLRVPMRYDATEPCVTSIGGDPRTEEGELMFPARFTPEAVALLEHNMGGAGSPVVESQLQQRPAPPGGLIFKAESFLDFELNEMPWLNTFNVLSVDCSFKDSLGSDYVCIEPWGARLSNFYNYDSFMERLGLSATIDAVKHMLTKWPAHAILVEDKANGPGVIETLRRELPNVLALDPKTSKIARAHAANVYFQAKSVRMLAKAAWRARKEKNLKHFPKAKNDDDVDATTMAVLYLASTGLTHFAAAVEAFKNEKSDLAKLLKGGPMGGFAAHFTVR